MKHHKEIQHFNIPVDLSMYDKLPYKLNPAICTKENISITSGNIIKRCNVKMDEEKHIIDPIPFDFDIVNTNANSSDSRPQNNVNNSVDSSDINKNTSEDAEYYSENDSTTVENVDAHYSED